MVEPIRLLLVSDFTISGWRPFLTPEFKTIVAPFGQAAATLMDGNSEIWRDQPEMACVWTLPEMAVPAFGELLEHKPVTLANVLADVDMFATRLHAAANRVQALFVPSWTLPVYDRGLGVLNMSPEVGPAYFLQKMNLHLAESVREQGNIHLLDAGRWLSLAGQGATNPKLWFAGKIAFGPAVMKAAAEDLKAAARAVMGKSRKLILLDLDDTLWGGVVGEIGWENLNLGGHDPVGEAYVAFQQRLKTLANRGIALGIVSKNEEEIALQAFDNHPEMVLRRDDFVGWRINWRDKAENLAELVSEVSVGLDAVVFIDDHPAERARIGQALPDVLVPDWPTDKMLFVQALAQLDCFDTLNITAEDRSRTAMYVSERKRRDLHKGVQSLDEYLSSLDLEITVEALNSANIKRATQLLNKTNQLNLATRRMTEAELTAWNETENQAVLTYRVADRFGDYGLTGLASLQFEGSQANVSDFLLSCRVMGRGVEQTMLHVLSLIAERSGATVLRARYFATPRNVPCKRFFDEKSGMSLEEDGDQARYSWDLSQPLPIPYYLRLRDPGQLLGDGPNSLIVATL